jgi:hypothetical protein
MGIRKDLALLRGVLAREKERAFAEARFLRTMERMRALYNGEPLPPQHEGGDCLDIEYMQHRLEQERRSKD